MRGNSSNSANDGSSNLGLETDGQDIEKVGFGILGMELLHFLAIIGNSIKKVHRLFVKVSGGFGNKQVLK